MFSKVKKLSQNNTATMQSKRTHSEVTESTPMTSNASKKQKTGSGPKKLYMMHEFDSTEIAGVGAKNTQQELVPKMVQKISHNLKLRKLYFRCGELSTCLVFCLQQKVLAGVMA